MIFLIRFNNILLSMSKYHTALHILPSHTSLNPIIIRRQVSGVVYVEPTPQGGNRTIDPIFPIGNGKDKR
jgi:hypothetical protein